MRSLLTDSPPCLDIELAHSVSTSWFSSFAIVHFFLAFAKNDLCPASIFAKSGNVDRDNRPYIQISEKNANFAEKPLPLITKRITFKNQNDLELSARLEMPIGTAPDHYAVFAHCFTCGKGIRAATMISRSLTQKGFAVLRFDFTGLGQSEGDFAETSFTTNVEDLIAAANYLEDTYKSPKLFVGHSLGGTAVIHAACRVESVEAVVTVGAPFEAEHVTHLFEDKKADIIEDGRAEVNIGGRTFEIGKEFIESLEKHTTASLLPDMRKALLVMHSPQDDIVHIDNAAEIYTAAHHPKSFVSLDGADHLLQNDHDGSYVAEVIAAWSARYIPKPDKPEMTHSEDVVVQVGSDAYTTEVWAGDHRLLADEPKEAGGNNMGPSPYQLLNAALGACTAMTLKMYAERKKWPLRQVSVALSHKRHYAEDSSDPEAKSNKVNAFKRVISIKGELDDEQKERLMDIARRCPVHKTLTDSRLIIEDILEKD